ncbi:MAG TPA: lasso peptide biosynthesis B2 protein [Candidatus Sumerlaeota bacterium]|nr:lasso peptide biosynthesis B2 protein [Candidatus Sumerlaeota bacterium]
MIRRLIRFFSLPRAERSLFVMTWGVLLAIRIALKTVSFRRLYRFCQWLAVHGRRGAEGYLDERFDALVALSVERACTWMPGRIMCLPRALTAVVVLALLGRPADLCIGVSRPAAQDFEAHAWVTRSGKVLVGTVEGIETFPTFPLNPNRTWTSQNCGV